MPNHPDFSSVPVFFLFLASLLLPAVPAAAQCGHPPNCTFPAYVRVCPAGDISVAGHVADQLGNPCIGSVVHMQFHPPAANTLWSAPTYPFPLASSSTNLSGTVVFWPMVGGCELGGFITYQDNAGVLLGTSQVVVSPDFNADGVVNLADLGLFATAFMGGYSPCADMNQDGVMNLTDVGIFSLHFGH